MADRLSFEEMRRHIALADGIAREAWVEMERDNGYVEGNLRHGVWTEEQQLSPADPRDAYVRITTRTGMEMVVSWAELIDLMGKKQLYVGDGW